MPSFPTIVSAPCRNSIIGLSQLSRNAFMLAVLQESLLVWIALASRCIPTVSGIKFSELGAAISDNILATT